MSPCWWITSVNSHIKRFCQILHIVSDKEFKFTNKFTLQISDFSRGNCKRPPKSKIVLPANGFVSLYRRTIYVVFCKVFFETTDISSIIFTTTSLCKFCHLRLIWWEIRGKGSKKLLEWTNRSWLLFLIYWLEYVGPAKEP